MQSPQMSSDYNLPLEPFVQLPFCFFKILFLRPIFFHIIAAEERYMQGYCVLRESAFLSRTALFDCGLAN